MTSVIRRNAWSGIPWLATDLGQKGSNETGSFWIAAEEPETVLESRGIWLGRNDMRKFLISMALVTIAWSASPALAGDNIQSPGKFGIGVELGFPGNGISMNWFMTQGTSLQIDFSIWLKSDWTGFGGRVDYLFWPGNIASWGWSDLVWYVGPGGNVFFFDWDGPGENDSYVRVGAELPIGIGFQFKGAPVDLTVEAVPILQILGNDGVDFDFDIAGVLNCRYYF